MVGMSKMREEDKAMNHDDDIKICNAATDTPAAKWREAGEQDPHGDTYKCRRKELGGGHLTDDELANEVYLTPNIANLTCAKERIRWLSRQLIEKAQRVDNLQNALHELMLEHEVPLSDYYKELLS
jgi:hypothetical protein